MWCPCKHLYRILVLMAIGNIVSACLRCKTGQRMKRIQRCERGSNAGSQNLIRLSSLADTRRPIITCHSTRLTSHPWRIRILSSRPFAIYRPRCGIVYVGLEILDNPDRTADAMYASAWVDVSARVAVLWTWRMVSNKAGQRLRTHE
jgi:hypothetical protein